MNPILIILLLGAGAYYFSGFIPEKEILRCTIKLLTLDSLRFETGNWVLKVSVAIDNPTKYLLSAKQPNVRLLYNGSEIGASVSGDAVTPLKGNDRALVKNIGLALPVSNTLIIATFFIDRQDKDFSIEVSTAINGVAIKSSKTYKVADLVNLSKKK
jgi:hypothetical protein